MKGIVPVARSEACLPGRATRFPALVAGLGWVGMLAACGDSSSCPDGAVLVSASQGDLVARYCRDAAGLPHGPFRLYEPADDPDSAVPRGEGTFDRGNPDGVFLYRFPKALLAARETGSGDLPEDPIRYRQEYLQGLWHGTWEERDLQGRLVARQHYDRGRRCGTWLIGSEGDEPLTREFTPCEDLPEPGPGETGEAAPMRTAFWSGESCPAGRLRSAGGEAWCEESGVRSGPWRAERGDIEIVGEYRDGLPEGRFVAFFRGRAVREWHVLAGREDGPARRWFPGGTLAEQGEYRQGLEQGTWTRWTPSGHLLERQEWDRGRRHGLQERFVPGGTRVEETRWQDGRREGNFSTFYDDGAPECRGTYQADLRQGPWTCLHPNGRKSLEGAYDRGNRQGTFRAYLDDGTPIFEGTYQDGTPEGTWRFFSESRQEDPEDRGLLVMEGVFRSGQREGWWEQRWDRDQVLSARIFFQDDLRHGPSRTFFHNGQVEFEGAFLAGKQHGAWRQYYRTGGIRVEAVFFQDVLDGPYAEYAPDGTLVRKGRYVNGFFIPDAGF